MPGHTYNAQNYAKSKISERVGCYDEMSVSLSTLSKNNIPLVMSAQVKTSKWKIHKAYSAN